MLILRCNLLSFFELLIFTTTTFKNILYLLTEIGKPKYVFEEEGDNRDGYFFCRKTDFRKNLQVYSVSSGVSLRRNAIYQNERLCFITDKYGHEYDCDTFLIIPKWETQGDIASVECEFQTETVVKKIAHGTTITTAEISTTI
ncbi:hypothetical protein [Pedobacter alluvionis]|uniref:Uncharacterized protein n=1 Tax=Pedobacter alluvionis TaxID=475253 RepID=A0A497YJK6_9SPHI|nr:hypothetical protein [Pedobacter alluvionis]RLJ80350.1 hypothetical protein BCL90_1112 [Pedobacter alluvionis]TFB31621.1 hypothetical protein E3V97_13645 [Pedobacter alluvionis]